MSELSGVIAEELAMPTGKIARLRVKAVNDHDCPYCGQVGGIHCKSNETGEWSAVPHDARIDLAYEAAIDRRIQWGWKQGHNQALREVQAGVAKLLGELE